FNQSTVVDPNAPNQPWSDFLVRWNGTLDISADLLTPSDDLFYFQLKSCSGATLLIDGKPVLWSASEPGDANLDGYTDFFDIGQLLSYHYNNNVYSTANAWLQG